MKKVPLGKSGYSISPIIYAGIVSMDERQADSDNYVAKSIDLGVNYFDIAPSYGNAEVIFGKSFKPYRKDVYLACKLPSARRRTRRRSSTNPWSTCIQTGLTSINCIL